MPMVEFTEQSFRRFKKAFSKTKTGDVFVFEGNEFLHDYARYLIMYIENKRGWKK